MDKEHQWLPRLAPHLPLDIPVPLASEIPGKGYPWKWSVYNWLEGENATIEHIDDPGQAARDLAHFIAALQQVDPTGGPPPSSHNSFRGEPLATRDTETRSAIASLVGMLDTEAATAAWEAALRAQHGTAHPFGSTETFHLLTCWSTRAGSAPSSTLGVWRGRSRL